MAAATAGATVGGERRLPPLRDEVMLHEGPRGRDGAPSWTLHDPGSNRFFRIGWAEMEMLARWHLGDPAAIALAVARETTIRTTTAQVEQFIRFLWSQGLLQAQGDGAIERMRAQEAATRPHFAKWLLKTYLFIRLPLVRPDRFLDATMPLAKQLYTKAFLVVTLLAGMLGVHLALRQWDAFTTTFLHFFSLEGAAMAALALTGAKIAHELGHAYTAKRFGCRVPSMGVVFLVLWPVLYTDVTDAWKLSSRRRRLAIGAAGMGAELVLACYATLAWSFLPDGPLRSAAFLLGSSTWVLTVLINVNPLMRFDGYYLLSDALDVPNLQDRAFALARWRLREWLFGLGARPPEVWPPAMRRLLLAYAFATWIYRFFLFFGIALLVYHLFFKLLGLFLMIIEIGWFILRPIQVELREWLRQRGHMRFNRNVTATLAIAVGAVGMLFVPWQGTIPAPAVLKAAYQQQLFVPKGAQLRERRAAAGQRVAAGEPLFRFESPDLQEDYRQAQRKLDVVQARVQVQSLSRDLIDRSQTTWRELEAAQAALAAAAAELDRLTVRAPAGGTLVDVTDPLEPGEWLREGTRLATVVDAERSVVEAYVPEDALGKLQVGASGRFLADDPGGRWIPVRVETVAATSSRVLAEPALASIHGGGIATHQGKDGALVPEAPVYRVVLRPEGPLPPAARVTRGEVLLEGTRESLMARVWRIAVGVFVRESGF